MIRRPSSSCPPTVQLDGNGSEDAVYERGLGRNACAKAVQGSLLEQPLVGGLACAHRAQSGLQSHSTTIVAATPRSRPPNATAR